MKTALSKKSFAGLTIVEVLMILAVIFVLALLLLPAHPHRRAKQQRIACVNNLKQIGLALRMWSSDSEAKFPWSVSASNDSRNTVEFVEPGQTWRHFQAISNELSLPKVLRCPSDTRQRAERWNEFNSDMRLSYFVGLEADEARLQTILSGDRNLATNGKPATGLLRLTTSTGVEWTKEIHKSQGNLGLSDGSVQQATIAALRKQIEDAIASDTNRAAIRLLIP